MIRWRVTWGNRGMLVCATLAHAQRLIRTLNRKGATNINLIAW